MFRILLILIIATTTNYSYERYELDADSCVVSLAMSIVKSQVGVIEATNRNDGYMINQYQKSVGIKQGKSNVIGDPYCAAGIYWSYMTAVDSLNLDKKYIPLPRSGSSQFAYTYAQENGKKATNQKPNINDVFIWRKKNSWQGHQGAIIEVGSKGWIYSVEFNTSGNGKNDEREGGGVFIKRRNYKYPLARLYVRGFVGFKYTDKSICDKVEYFELSKSDYVDTLLLESKKHKRPDDDIVMKIYKIFNIISRE